MPLLPGKKNIGHNISELESAGHPTKQSEAIALKEAGVNKDNRVNRDDDIVNVGPPGLTLADIAARNRQYWEPEKQVSMETKASQKAPEPLSADEPTMADAMSKEEAQRRIPAVEKRIKELAGDLRENKDRDEFEKLTGNLSELRNIAQGGTGAFYKGGASK